MLHVNVLNAVSQAICQASYDTTDTFQKSFVSPCAVVPQFESISTFADANDVVNVVGIIFVFTSDHAICCTT
ncbi:hypothetical protein HOG21_00595 [bacterium]|nr:hypothetical protein [bacterium]